MPGRGDLHRPNGPLLVAAIVLTGVGVSAQVWATSFPADPAFERPAQLLGVAAVVCLLASTRRVPDGFADRWSATLLIAVSALAVAIAAWAFASDAVFILALPAGLVALATGLIGFAQWCRGLGGRRRDALLATAMLAPIALAAVASSMDLKLRGPVGDRMEQEAAALRRDPAAVPRDAWASGGRFLLEGTDRELVAWRSGQAFLSSTVLVHDPSGRVGIDGWSESAVECRRVTGPWWTCRVD